MNYWQDKVAIVTGGSSGLGLAVSKALVGHGARVIIAARDPDRLQSAATAVGSGPGRAQTIITDVTRDQDVRELAAHSLSEHGRLNALIHCVGISDRGDAMTTTLERYQELWELNFLSAVRCAQAFADPLIESRGHLVFIGSLASKIAARYLGAYPTSKFPLAALAQQLRLEMGPRGLHVLLTCPGPIAREDAGRRYDQQAAGLPESAHKPGGGVKLKGIDPAKLAEKILIACRARRRELIVPGRARLLCVLGQLSPALGDWLVRKFT
jgi:NAD(P)-dependent dehydrogenase (short-subunit alcohol dehydrogenase family)